MCSESRSEAKKLYPLRFATDDSPAMIRVNFEVDTIQMDYQQCLGDGITLKADIEAIRFLEVRDINFRIPSRRSIWGSLLAHQNLQQFTMVSPPPQSYSSGSEYLVHALQSRFNDLHRGEPALSDLDELYRGNLETVAWVIVMEDGGREFYGGSAYWEDAEDSSFKTAGSLQVRQINGNGFCNADEEASGSRLRAVGLEPGIWPEDGSGGFWERLWDE